MYRKKGECAIRISKKLLFVSAALLIISMVGVPGHRKERPIGPGEMFKDILTLNGAVTGFSMLPGVSSGGIGLELRQHGDMERGVKEFFRFWDYGYTIPESKASFKKNNLLVIHPVIGYQFSNYLLSKGYSRKMALLTTTLGVYLLEKGIEGSFETPSAYDLLSYFSGAVISVAVNESVEKLYNRHYLLKPVAVALNPFVMFHRERPSDR